MTIIGTVFNIISFIFSNYVFIEISYNISFQVLLGSVLYSNHMLVIVLLLQSLTYLLLEINIENVLIIYLIK